jgi:hypothetical protein
MRTSILLLAVISCAPRAYVYAPVTTTSAEVAGRPAASYPIPRDAPEGTAQIVSFGVADVQPEEAGELVRALCMRLIVANQSERGWSVDARVQALVFEDGQEATPMYALAPGAPMVEVPGGRTQTIDLFFPLPAGAEDARALPRFDAVWSVRTSRSVVTGRTPFARSAVEPKAYADIAAPFWLDRLDPAFSYVTFVRLEGPYLRPGR